MRRIPGAILILSLAALPAWAKPVRITGRILPSEASGARVELRRFPQGSADQPEPAPVTAKAAADLSFEIMAPALGLYRLTAQAEGFSPSVEVVPVVEETDLAVWLRPAGVPREVARRSATPTSAEIRRGRVVDSLTQAPLPGALVWQAGLDAGEDVSWTWADDDGRFRLAVRGSDPAIGAAAAGHLSIPRYSLGPVGPATVALRPAVTLAGQIVDPEGRPVAGASVKASPVQSGPDGWPDARQTRTGAEGRFLFRGLSPKQGYRLAAQAAGFASAGEEVELRQSGQETPPVRIVLSRGVTFTGRIVDPDGQPVAGADLVLNTTAEGLEGGGSSASAEASSGPTGRFRFDHAGAGYYFLRMIRSGFVPAHRAGTVETPPRGMVDLGDLTLERGAAIEGRITDPGGRPVEGAQIVNSTRERDWSAPSESPTRTGPDGSFRIDGLESGRAFDLALSKPGYVPARVSGVEAPTKEPLHIELRPARSLSGRVLDAERRPIRSALILLVEDNSSFTASHQVGLTDEGRFVLSELEPGPLHLEIGARGFRTAELRLSEDEDAAPVEIVLEPGAVLEGRVLDGKGQPVRQASIQISLPEARSSSDPLVQSRSLNVQNGPSPIPPWLCEGLCATDDQGQYRIGGLGPGEHRVEARGGSGLLAEGTIVLGDSGTYRLDLQFPSVPVADVSGRVVDEQGEPLRGAALSLQPVEDDQAQPSFSARSLSDGSFRFRDVPEGTYRLSGSAPGYPDQVAPDEVVVVAGREVGGLLLRLARSGTERSEE